MQPVAREDGQEAVVDRELNGAGDVIQLGSLAFGESLALERGRDVRTSERTSRLGVELPSPDEELARCLERPLVERLVDRTPGRRNRHALGVREGEDTGHERVHSLSAGIRARHPVLTLCADRAV